MNGIFAGIATLPLEPIMYALAIAWGYMSMISKFKQGRFVVLVIEIAIFTSIFMMHGGTIAGGFAAALAAPLVSWIAFPKTKSKTKPRHLLPTITRGY